MVAVARRAGPDFSGTAIGRLELHRPLRLHLHPLPRAHRHLGRRAATVASSGLSACRGPASHHLAHRSRRRPRRPHLRHRHQRRCESCQPRRPRGPAAWHRDRATAECRGVMAATGPAAGARKNSPTPRRRKTRRSSAAGTRAGCNRAQIGSFHLRRDRRESRGRALMTCPAAFHARPGG
jgi:hypothetical protein